LVISLDKVSGEALCRKTGIPESGLDRIAYTFSFRDTDNTTTITATLSWYLG
jgi:hypothetical protein